MNYLDKLRHLQPEPRTESPGDISLPTAAPLQPGNRIAWTRGDGSTQTGVIADLHTDPAGATWAFITLPGGLWTAVNLKFARVA